MRKRPTKHQNWLKVAEVIAERSHDPDTQVGCVIVDKNNRIISTGYNGFFAGADDENLPTTRPEKYFYMCHAEISAIVHAKCDLTDCTLYCTLSPCNDCAKAIISSGIKQVILKEIRDVAQLDLLTKFGVEWRKYGNS